jgi:cobyrinic acid a,c-diamide synthase
LSVKKIIIAGVASGVGKTTVSGAVIYSLKKKGFSVQPFKIGPDYIDVSYHSLISGRQCRNLDVWMMRTSGVLDSFNQSCVDADIAVIEGVMGLFDGISGRDDFGSTAHVARLLDAPIILVIDAAKSARSIAALAFGFIHFSKSIKFRGVILNNVAGQRHATFIKEAFSNKIKTPIIGMIMRNEKIAMEERHLGLIPASELDDTKKWEMIRSAKYVADYINVDKLVAASDQPIDSSSLPKSVNRPPGDLKIAVALDESFNFYYADNLDALRKQKISLVFFSPIHDSGLPGDISGVMLGGGFPEVMADRLTRNHSMKNSILKAAEGGVPIYAECGGLMYLTRSVTVPYRSSAGKVDDYCGKMKTHSMVGLFEADTVMDQKLTLNYTEANCNASFFSRIGNIHGHEFHYSKIRDLPSDARLAYALRKGEGIYNEKDGLVAENCLASYMHIHFADSRLARRLGESFMKYKRR